MLLPRPGADGIIRFDDGIIIDMARARIVCNEAMNAFYANRGLYSIIRQQFDAPQNRFIPIGVEKGSPTHVLWLFFTALTDRREVSENVYSAAVALHAENPWIYGPGSGRTEREVSEYLDSLRFVAKTVEITFRLDQRLLFDGKNPLAFPPKLRKLVELAIAIDPLAEEVTAVIPNKVSSIENVLRAKKVGSPGQSASYWPQVAETLYREFNGDPLEIFRRFPTIADFIRFKRGRRRKMKKDPFPGIGPKIASLMTMFYDELGLMSMPEDAMPVDVHLQRFALETGIIRYEGTKKLYNELVEHYSRRMYCDICNENAWPHVDFSHATWFLSKRLCSSCHRKKIAQTLCPTFDLCLGSIASNSYFRRGIWEIKHRQKNGGTIHR